MVKILVTGKTSYIANSFKSYIDNNFSNNYYVDVISVRNDKINSISLREYDVVFHCAGIAHSDNGSISKNKEKEYYNVNTELTYNIAKKAYDDGVRHFIYMSSIIIYGNAASIGEKKIITKDTLPCPANAYGDSKLKAEKRLISLHNEYKDFIVSIIRSPMVYGDKCKGNFSTLKKMSNLVPIFPYIENERSVINIDKLCEHIRQIIDNQISNISNIYFPQDESYMCTSKTVRLMAESVNKHILMIKGLDKLFKFLSLYFPIVNKIFGNIVYDKELNIISL